MSISLMTDVWRLPLQASRKMVLLALADNANDEGTDCWPSIGKLVEKCSMSERSIQVHLAALEDSGYIKRHERLGRSNKFTIYVERVRAELYKKPSSEKCGLPKVSAKRERIEAPSQILHPSPSNPHSTHTPAESAPLQKLHPTPAESAPITTHEPSITTTTTNLENSGCGGESLIYPKTTVEEQIILENLMQECPLSHRQLALDEIEGARQARVIKTNLIPFARGIVKAIRKGTFTVGHGAKIRSQRIRQSTLQVAPRAVELSLDPAILNKGRALMDRFGAPRRLNKTFTVKIDHGIPQMR